MTEAKGTVPMKAGSLCRKLKHIVHCFRAIVFVSFSSRMDLERKNYRKNVIRRNSVCDRETDASLDLFVHILDP